MLSALCLNHEGKWNLCFKYKENIKTFTNISCHIKLKAKCLGMQHTRLVAYVEQKHVNKPKHKGQGKCGSTVGNLGLEKGKKKGSRGVSKIEIRIWPKWNAKTMESWATFLVSALS